jgi:hypothetical protein
MRLHALQIVPAAPGRAHWRAARLSRRHRPSHPDSGPRRYRRRGSPATLPADAAGSTESHDRRRLARCRDLVDEVLAALGKERADAVAVFRYGNDAIIGATAVEGVEGDTLLTAFRDAWAAPAVIQRRQRPVAGTVGWQLTIRNGGYVVVYTFANVVYLVSAPDFIRLEAILADMPPGGP